MGLPVLDTPRYQCELPSTGETIEFRPFLVKEQKLLLMMKEDESEAAVLETVRQLLESVVYTKLDIRKLPSFDIEYLFLQVRCKSIGETIQLRFYCRNNECEDGSADVEIKLEDVKVDKTNEKSNDVQVGEDIGITFRYPNIEVLQEVSDIEDTEEQTFQLIRLCGDTIYDSENVYNLSDAEEDEIIAFYESLTIESSRKIQEFFLGMPRLSHKVEYECSKCGTKGERELRGLSNFF
jgi:hypothetical protein